ncbi:hypothetical protein UA08_05685 [Talaromyces atroroseus]|uniref:Holocytochrome c-type synthase n=1 Tax=Talaromyces atroroseus TaxID=1441469 RepID=A0A225AKF5_TALAT|nr:hypothetical protein UA08_05685 [Talaromyces atroroseus]OKL58784.1 hypothetical protein UA08_05685 [Talaromyces atroroseus]
MGASASTPSVHPESQCPVDHKTREIWLQQHQGSAGGAPHPIPHKLDDNGKVINENAGTKQRQLSNDREISSIPRAFDANPSDTANSQQQQTIPSPYAAQSTASHSSPSNSESETGHDPATGNWVYPSERQFFDALVRKSNVPGSTKSAKELATSVASIIPIHNAVNEKAWQEILKWESRAPSSDPGSNKCGGPKLYAFRGLGTESQFVSPRARLNGLMGYQLPFDRHDWVVERCGGERVEYVIDFYQGKPVASSASSQPENGSGIMNATGPGKLSFYLDVRPKLNSVEGWRMRFNRYWGL